MHAINCPRCARPPLRKWELAFIDEVFSPHFVLHTVLTPGWPRNLEGARKLFTTMLAAAPDVQGIDLKYCGSRKGGAGSSPASGMKTCIRPWLTVALFADRVISHP